VGDENLLGLGFFNRRQQARPIRMIGQHESAIEVVLPSPAANPHPARREGHGAVAQSAQPGRSAHGRRRDNHSRSLERFYLRGDAGLDRGQFHPGGGVGVQKPGHGSVGKDRPDVVTEFDQQPLGFSQCVGEHHAGTTVGPVARDPSPHIRDDGGCRGPAEDRQGKRRFGDKHMALERLERLAGWVTRSFVVPADHHHLAAVLDAHLRRAEDVTSRM
jgi:hypothetical protein